MIPVGLLSYTAMLNGMTPGLLNGPQQGYWQGNQFIPPVFTYTRPETALPTKETAPPAAAMAGDKATATPPDPGAMYGTGAQGEMGMTGAPGMTSPAAPTAPSPAVAGLSPIDPRDLPSLPSMPEQAPSAPVAPAPGLAPAAPETSPPAGKAEPPSKSIAGMPGMPGIPGTETGLVDAAKEMADKAKADLAAIGKEVFGVPGTVMADEEDMAMMDRAEKDMRDRADQESNFNDQNSQTGLSAAQDQEQGTGSPPGTGVSTDQNSDEGGVGYRKGGRVKSNADGHLQPVPGILHEGEFVMNPEMTMTMDKLAPGLLTRIAKMQKHMVGKMGNMGKMG